MLVPEGLLHKFLIVFSSVPPQKYGEVGMQKIPTTTNLRKSSPFCFTENTITQTLCHSEGIQKVIANKDCNLLVYKDNFLEGGFWDTSCNKKWVLPIINCIYT